MKKSVFRYLAFALAATFCLGAAAPAAYAEEAGSILPVYEEDRTAENRTETEQEIVRRLRQMAEKPCLLRK